MTCGSAPRSNATMDVFFPQPYNAVLAIVSSSLSVFGALALIATYFFWKSNRTISRFIVACIAASDLLTASGYIVMSSYLLWLQKRLHFLGNVVSFEDIFHNDSFSVLRKLCTAQSFVTTTSSSWSFWWTAILAFHLYLILVHMQWTLAKRLVWVYVVVATVVPLVYTIPALATGWLGVGCFSATTTWCFVGINPSQESPVNLTCDFPGVTYKVLEAVEGKVWEVMAFLTILVLYLSIWCTMVKIRAQRSPERHALLYKDIKAVSRVVDRKILFIPVVFLFIRVWSMLRYFLSLSPVSWEWATSGGGQGLSQFLIAMESIFDGSQGWTNALLFLVLSKKSVDVMSHAYRRVRQACGSCQVNLSCRQPNDEQSAPVNSSVLYANVEAAKADGKVTLNTTP